MAYNPRKSNISKYFFEDYSEIKWIINPFEENHVNADLKIEYKYVKTKVSF